MRRRGEGPRGEIGRREDLPRPPAPEADPDAKKRIIEEFRTRAAGLKEVIDQNRGKEDLVKSVIDFLERAEYKLTNLLARVAAPNGFEVIRKEGSQGVVVRIIEQNRRVDIDPDEIFPSEPSGSRESGS